MDETEYLFSSEQNAKRLRESLEASKKGDVITLEFEDLEELTRPVLEPSSVSV